MASPDARAVQDGLANVSHAIRRSTALYLAFIGSPEGTTDEELFARAQTYSDWIRGNAEKPKGQPPLLGDPVPD